MKKLISGCFILISFILNAQIEKNEDDIISNNGQYFFYLKKNENKLIPKYSISKIDGESNKTIFEIFLNIPDKKKNELCYTTGTNKISTVLVGNEIQIIYDIYDKKYNLKKCYFKSLNIDNGILSESKLLYETPCESRFTMVNTNYRVIYSEDKSKFALLLDNYNAGIYVEPSITIYDANKINLLASKKLKSQYNGLKMQIDPYKNFNLDNDGNITLMFNTFNNKTNITVNQYYGNILFNENDITNIKEVKDIPTDNTEDVISRSEQGRFYNYIEDYINNKPLEDFKVKNGSYKSLGFGLDVKEFFIVSDKNGDIEEVSVFKLPSMLFTYRGEYAANFEFFKAFEGKVYKVIRTGNICLYAFNGDNSYLFYSEGGINGALKEFKDKDFEIILEKANLLDDYKNDLPKREFKDGALDTFFKQLDRYIKYIDLLNKK